VRGEGSVAVSHKDGVSGPAGKGGRAGYDKAGRCTRCIHGTPCHQEVRKRVAQIVSAPGICTRPVEYAVCRSQGDGRRILDLVGPEETHGTPVDRQITSQGWHPRSVQHQNALIHDGGSRERVHGAARQRELAGAILSKSVVARQNGGDRGIGIGHNGGSCIVSQIQSKGIGSTGNGVAGQVKDKAAGGDGFTQCNGTRAAGEAAGEERPVVPLRPSHVRCSAVQAPIGRGGAPTSGPILNACGTIRVPDEVVSLGSGRGKQERDRSNQSVPLVPTGLPEEEGKCDHGWSDCKKSLEARPS